MQLLHLAVTAAVGANRTYGLPANLALEPVAGGDTDRLLAVLIGVNTGPLALVRGSRANLLQLGRCWTRGVTASVGDSAVTAPSSPRPRCSPRSATGALVF